MTVYPDNIPASLKAIPQWVVWRYEDRDGKRTKVPYQARRASRASSTDPSTWCSFNEALSQHLATYGYPGSMEFDGIGIVLTEELGIVGVDLDHISEWQEGANGIVAALDSYSEVTPSGDGYRVFVKATLPPGRKRKGHVEMYSSGRFLTVTGNFIQGSKEVEDRPGQLSNVHQEWLGESVPLAVPDFIFGKEVVLELADAEIVARAMAASNGAKFSELWHGLMLGDEAIDRSALDLALCSLLAFWTQDPLQLDRLFRASALMRDKWERSDYRAWTLRRALNRAETWGPPLEGDLRANSPANRGALSLKRAEPGVVDHSEDLLTVDQERHAADLALSVSGELDDGLPSLAVDDVVHAAESTPAVRGRADADNARRLVARYADRLRYSATLGKWLSWDGRRWLVDDTFRVMVAAEETVRDRVREVGSDPDRAKALLKQIEDSLSLGRLEAMVKLARGPLAVSSDEMDADPWKLNCLNGTLDLRAGRLLPHEPTDLITKLAPVNFDPAAKAPRFMEFLDRIMASNQALIAFLQRAAGYSLTGSIKDRVMFVLHGTGRNGKTTFVEALNGTLGDYAMTAGAETLMMKQDANGGASGDVARLKGSRYVASSETNEGKALDEARIKAITGGDKITCRFLYQESFTFIPTFKIWLATNHLPMIRGTDRGIWDRIRLIPFLVRIGDDEVDGDIHEKLAAERAGILAWAVQGCLAWRTDGGLTTPREVVDATQEYRSDMDILADFLEERTDAKPGLSIPPRLLYTAYREWAEATGHKPMSETMLGRKVKERGFVLGRHGNGKIYLGLGIRSSLYEYRPLPESLMGNNVNIGFRETGLNSDRPALIPPDRLPW